MSDHNYDEKRDFARMNIDTQITYTIKNTDGQHHYASSGDLSATGLYMSTDFELSEGNEITIIMNPNGDRLPPFTAEGRVIRVTSDEATENLFYISVALTKTS